jgi:hypothetical protein
MTYALIGLVIIAIALVFWKRPAKSKKKKKGR